MGTAQIVDQIRTVAPVSSTVDRRHFLKLVAGASAIAVAGGASLVRISGVAALEESYHYRTTTSLNLRQKPSTTSTVLKVLPQGAIVENLYERKSGFVKVAHQGTWGWASRDYLAVSNSGSADPPTIIGTGITTDAVNFRTGPSTGHAVIRVLAKGTTVAISDRVEYDFRYVEVGGRGGYVADAYLGNDTGGGNGSGGDGATKFKTTTAVNLRAKASTSSKVVTVVPKGATVLDYDLEMANGFRSIDYKGTVGWIYDDYLTEV